MGQRRVFSDVDQAEIVRMHMQRESRHTIARAFGTKSNQINKVLIANGIELVYWRKNRLTIAEEATTVARYTAGEEATVLADEYGVDRVTIYNVLKRAGVPRRPRGGQERRFTDDDIARMGELYQAGWSQERIAEEFHCAQTSVSRFLIADGLRPQTIDQTGAGGNNWQGGKVSLWNGYVMRLVPADHPFAAMRMRLGYILEHRLVMAEALGRPLMAHETVHHIDGDKANNDLANLQLRFGKHGKGVAYCCADCGSRNIVPCPLEE